MFLGVLKQPPLLLYHLPLLLCKSERFWRATFNFSYKPPTLYLLMGARWEGSIRGNREGEGWRGAPWLPFHSSIEELESCFFDDRGCVPGMRHSSLLPQRETSQACRPLKPVASHQSVTLCAFSFPRTCRQKTTQACSPCQTASHLDLLALLLSPSLPYLLTLLLDILSCGSWIEDPLKQLCSRLWGTCFLLTLHLFLTPWWL